MEFLHLDLNDEKSIDTAAKELKNKFSGIDILINNAGKKFDANCTNCKLLQSMDLLIILSPKSLLTPIILRLSTYWTNSYLLLDLEVV